MAKWSNDQMTQFFQPSLHRFTVFTAACTLLLLVAGALVTSNDAGLSIPDWPLNYGGAVPPLVGGIRYEWTHRLIASFVGLLTIVLAAWLSRRDPRSWVRRLGWAALAIIIAQGILGGLTVLFLQRQPLSAIHATLAQLFFCTVVSLAVFTGRWWQSNHAHHEDSSRPTVRTLVVWTCAAVFLQLILGAAFRHKGIGIVPHVVGAGVVTFLVLWTTQATRHRFSKVALLSHVALVLRVLLICQLVLGAAAWWSRHFAAQFPQPIPVMVVLTVVHTVLGAVVLAAALLTALITYRLIVPERSWSGVPESHQVVSR